MVTFPRAEITTVSIGLIRLNGLMVEDGTFGIAVPQVCSVFQILNKNAQRDIKAILGKGFQFTKCITSLHPKAVNVLLLPDFEYLIYCLALKGNKFAKKLATELPINSLAYIKALDTVGETKKKLKSQQGYVYLLDSGVVLKLGYSTNVKSRIKALQRWDGELELLITKKGTLDDEQRFHRYLKATGESFGDEWYPSYRKLEILSVLDTKCLKESKDL